MHGPLNVGRLAFVCHCRIVQDFDVDVITWLKKEKGDRRRGEVQKGYRKNV